MAINILRCKRSFLQSPQYLFECKLHLPLEGIKSKGHGFPPVTQLSEQFVWHINDEFQTVVTDCKYGHVHDTVLDLGRR